jgi:hypothetical protein
MWFFIPIIFFVICQSYLHWALDISDMPGAAGTWSLYLAAAGTPRDDVAALLYQSLEQNSTFTFLQLYHIVSIFFGTLAVIGGILAGYAFEGKRGGLYSGLLFSCWPMIHLFALLSGNDPISFGLSWFSLGLIILGCKGNIRLVPLAMIGVTLFPFSVQAKEISLPALCFVTLVVLNIPRKNKYSWLFFMVLVPVILYSTYWAYAWFWPTKKSLLTERPDIHFRSLQQGWIRIFEFHTRGLPEGKFEQLSLLSLIAPLGLFFTPYKRSALRYIGVSLIGIIVLGMTAYLLQQRSRPRYLAIAGFPMLLGIGVTIAKYRLHRIFISGIILFLLLDTWGFLYSWSAFRKEMVNSETSKLYTPPYLWTWQYKNMPDIPHRDLSMYGASELVRRFERGEGIASMRLRDARDRSVMAYALLYGQKHVILDPGICCKGKPVDEICAMQVVRQVSQSGLTLSLPTNIDDIERIYKNEKRWRDLLQSAAQQTLLLDNGELWWNYLPLANSEEMPCQKIKKAIPHR